MGCDIHPYVEYRGKDGRWHAADPWVKDDKYGEGDPQWRVPYHCGINRNRDYNWFAFIADVRNGTWGEPFPVIATPKGMPEDASKHIAEAGEEYGGDGHSHSYLTLGELEAGWKEHKDKLIKYCAAVGGIGREESPKLAAWLSLPPLQRRTSPPGGFSQSAWGPGGEYPKHEWYRTVEDEIATKYNQWRDYLWNVGFEFSVKDRDNDVRVVFWFDN